MFKRFSPRSVVSTSVQHAAARCCGGTPTGHSRTFMVRQQAHFCWRESLVGTCTRCTTYRCMGDMAGTPEMAKREKEKFMSLAYEVKPQLYRGFDPDKEPIPHEIIENYVNHSCDGNTWYDGDEKLIAIRNIEEGEEIAYDYALTESNPDWILAPKCLCSAEICRGLVTGNDWKQPHLQQKYAGHFTSHVQQKIDELKSQLK